MQQLLDTTVGLSPSQAPNRADIFDKPAFQTLKHHAETGVSAQVPSVRTCSVWSCRVLRFTQVYFNYIRQYSAGNLYKSSGFIIACVFGTNLDQVAGLQVLPLADHLLMAPQHINA